MLEGTATVIFFCVPKKLDKVTKENLRAPRTLCEGPPVNCEVTFRTGLDLLIRCGNNKIFSHPFCAILWQQTSRSELDLSFRFPGQVHSLTLPFVLIQAR